MSPHLHCRAALLPRLLWWRTWKQGVYFGSGSLLVFLQHMKFVTKLFKHEYCCAHLVLVRIYCCIQTCQTSANSAATIISAGKNNSELWKDKPLLQFLWEQKHINTLTQPTSTLVPPRSAEGRSHLHHGKRLFSSFTNKPQVCHSVGLLPYSCWISSQGVTFKSQIFYDGLPDWN